MRLIGEILLEISELDQASLERGLAVQQEKGGRIGEVLLHQKAIPAAPESNPGSRSGQGIKPAARP
jgi:hypothetical protein